MLQTVNKVLHKLGFSLVRDIGPYGHLFSLEDLQDRGFLPASVLDVGAAQGMWTEKCLQVYPQASYFLIDPLEENRPRLLALQAERNNVQFLMTAAGPARGTAQLRVQDDLDGSSFLEDADPRFSGRLRQVPVVCIDDLLAENRLGLPQLIKIDVQGFELQVLEGAKRALGVSEVIIMEVSLFSLVKGAPLFHEVSAFMHAHGYVLYDIAMVIRRPLDQALAQIDGVFVLQESRLRQSHLWYPQGH